MECKNKIQEIIVFFFNILFPSGKAFQVEEISSVILAGKKERLFRKLQRFV